MVHHVLLSPHCACSTFSSEMGCSEHHISATSTPGVSFAEGLREIELAYCQALNALKCNGDSLLFSRPYLSDARNQKVSLRKSSLFAMLRKGALSVVEQPPLCSGPISLLAYLVQDTASHELLAGDAATQRNALRVKGRHYSMLWTANYQSPCAFSSAAQTSELFGAHSRTLRDSDMTLVDTTVRTWIYVRDIDNHYSGMVAARKSYFAENGLTDKTRYIASTGIEGRTFEPSTLVTLDSLSIGGLVPGQLVRMEALSHMSSTIEYGVTFERGQRIRFGDRSHLYISGTASIDKNGGVMHCGDVRMQTYRTIENISALLSPHSATLRDLAYVIIYIRDPNGLSEVERVCNELLSPTLPRVYLRAAVCRPAWLVEMEGVAIVNDTTLYPPFL